MSWFIAFTNKGKFGTFEASSSVAAFEQASMQLGVIAGTIIVFELPGPPLSCREFKTPALYSGRGLDVADVAELLGEFNPDAPTPQVVRLSVKYTPPKQDPDYGRGECGDVLGELARAWDSTELTPSQQDDCQRIADELAATTLPQASPEPAPNQPETP